MVNRVIQPRIMFESCQDILRLLKICLLYTSDPDVIEKSKRTLGQMEAVLGNDNTINSLVSDILDHYENYREGLLTGKAMIVAYSRPIAMKIYKRILELRPAWTEKVGIVMTGGNNDPEEWHDIIGNKRHKDELAKKFKDNNSPMKIAIVVDMWLTGFDVPSLATKMCIRDSYYMGCIICTGGAVNKVIDGQQRLTSLTLLLIYLNNLQKSQATSQDEIIKLDDMIFDTHFGKKTFNIDVPEREKCMHALFNGDSTYVADNESTQNMLERYADIEEYFPDELKGEALPFFIYWLIERVLLLEIDTPSEDEAHTIFLTRCV